MEKRQLKRLGYGFSALVMGLSAVNFFPLSGGAYATAGGGDWCTKEDIYLCKVTMTEEPESLEYAIDGEPLVFKGKFNAGLVVKVDGEVTTEGLTITGLNFVFEFAPEEEGEHVIEFLPVAHDDETAIGEIKSYTVIAASDDEDNSIYEYIDKAANVGESFTVKAAQKGTVTVENTTDYPIVIGDAGEPVWATEDQITIVESAPGEYEIMPLEAGQYAIRIQGYDTVDGVLVDRTTEVMVLAVGATTNAATTITDVLNEYSKAEEVAEKAWQEYEAVRNNPDATEEEIEAANKAYQEKSREAFWGAALKRINAFGDDTDSIMNAIYNGQTISTDVLAAELDEADVADEVKEALLADLDVTFASNVKFYDIDVNVYADGEFVGTLKELTSTQVIVLSGFDGPAAGFNRVFKVLGYHTYYDAEGNEQVEIIEIDDVEFDEETGSIIFGADKFSTYLVTYKDELAASVNTGAFTGEGSSASASIATSVVAAIVAVALFGAFKFAKRR